LNILNYTITSNHVHLLVVDAGERDVIPRSMQLVAGRTGQEYNNRKSRKGAYWEDRYHATAVESGEHFIRCMVYIDTNMIRAGAVSHPSMWSFCGYNEIQEPRRKNVLIDYEILKNLTGFRSYEELVISQRGWIEEYLENGANHRQDEWTKSIAVGSKSFVENVKADLGFKAKGRGIIEEGEGFQLREEHNRYNVFFESKKDDIAYENSHFWEVYDE
jgi:hypothetical protein